MKFCVKHYNNAKNFCVHISRNCVRCTLHNRATFLNELFCSYLGQGQEITGRTILDEDLVQEIAIISRPGIILMPGQTLPMNFFRKSH